MSTVTHLIRDIVSGPRVRVQLSEQRIDMFVELYRTGAQVPDIEIYRGTNEIRAGHHRRAALKRLAWEDREMGFKEVPRPRDPVELVVDAFADNVGGSHQPSIQDCVYVMRGLLEKGHKEGKIRDSFVRRLQGTYTEKMIRGFIKTAKGQIIQRKMDAALADIGENELTVSAAAEKHGVDPAALKEKIGPKRKGSLDVSAIKKTISDLARGHTKKVTAAVKDILNKFEEGVADARSATEVLAHIESLNARAVSAAIKARQKLEKLGGPKYKGKTKSGRKPRSRAEPGRNCRKRTHRHHRRELPASVGEARAD